MNAHFATRPFGSKKMKSGFSLIELMIVVGIIGILATLATPRLRTFQARARQAETKSGLTQIFTLQTINKDDPTQNVYRENMALSTATNTGVATCRNGNALGFSINDCTQVRYVYALADVADPVTTFTGTATETNARVTGVPVGGTCVADGWTIDENSQMVHPAASDGIALCL